MVCIPRLSLPPLHRTALKVSDSPFILDPFEDLFKRIPRFVFVTGKGGVGKTSLSCALAVNLAERGRAVLLVSTDPASNLDEVLQTPLGASPTPISGVPGLRAMNINPSAAAAVYRESVVAPYRAALPAEVVSNIEEQLSGACTVEIAAFNEFAALMDDTEATGAFEHIIFDTAPSGHTLRLLALPAAWTDFLQGSPVGASCLGPLQGLAAYKDRYERVLQALRDPSLTLLTLVARAQAATLQEAARTGDELAGLGLKNQCLVINAVMTAARDDDPLAQSMLKQTQEALREIPKSLRNLDRWTIALKPKQVLGLEQLRQVFSAPGVVAEDAASSLPMAHNHCPDLDALIARLAAAGPGLIMTMGKGGVGKTTVAAMVARGLARQGHQVHLTTTDPANHLSNMSLPDAERLSLGCVDPSKELERYRKKVLDAAKDLDPQALALLKEDLASPCTQEIAVFEGFAREVARAEGGYVVVDTAPTGHTVLLLEAAQAYQRDVLRQPGTVASEVVELLPRLRDPAFTRVLICTLPEPTPVHEAAALQSDLDRAGLAVFAWVVNQSFAVLNVTDPLLRARQAQEAIILREVIALTRSQPHLIPWISDHALSACLPCHVPELTPG
ncbi:MAG: hypothetical protein RI949_1011 [Pseudomonadota bacterium]